MRTFTSSQPNVSYFKSPDLIRWSQSFFVSIKPRGPIPMKLSARKRSKKAVSPRNSAAAQSSESFFTLCSTLFSVLTLITRLLYNLTKLHCMVRLDCFWRLKAASFVPRELLRTSPAMDKWEERLLRDITSSTLLTTINDAPSTTRQLPSKQPSFS